MIITEDGTTQFPATAGLKYVFSASGNFGGGTISLQWSDGTEWITFPQCALTAGDTQVVTAPTLLLRFLVEGTTSPNISANIVPAVNKHPSGADSPVTYDAALVSGAGVPTVNGTYIKSDDQNGKASFVFGDQSIAWDGSQWVIYDGDTIGDNVYVSTDGTEFPWQAKFSSLDPGYDPVPNVSQAARTIQEALDAGSASQAAILVKYSIVANQIYPAITDYTAALDSGSFISGGGYQVGDSLVMPIAGAYLISFYSAIPNFDTTGGGLIFFALYVNSVLITRGPILAPAQDQTFAPTATFPVQLQAGDAVSFVVTNFFPNDQTSNSIEFSITKL